jgi:anti-anti-sigma regulatory factor
MSTQPDIMAELPADYEQLLKDRLQQVLADTGPLTVEVNLEGQAVISSRQLGSLIALQKVLRPRFGSIPLIGVSENIRHLLTRTHVDKLFDLK